MMKSFVVGFILGAFMFMIPASAIKTVVERMENELVDFAAGSSCRTATVEDIDLWDRSMLISVKGLKFVMSAVNKSTYEICVVDDNIQTLDEARKPQ